MSGTRPDWIEEWIALHCKRCDSVDLLDAGDQKAVEHFRQEHASCDAIADAFSVDIDDPTN